VQQLLQEISNNYLLRKCMFLALGTQHAMHMRHIIICDFSGSTIFFHHYLINSMIFEKKITVHEMCVLIFSTAFA